jgi:hypothetical protein
MKRPQIYTNTSQPCSAPSRRLPGYAIRHLQGRHPPHALNACIRAPLQQSMLCGSEPAPIRLQGKGDGNMSIPLLLLCGSIAHTRPNVLLAPHCARAVHVSDHARCARCLLGCSGFCRLTSARSGFGGHLAALISSHDSSFRPTDTLTHQNTGARGGAAPPQERTSYASRLARGSRHRHTPPAGYQQEFPGIAHACVKLTTDATCACMET